MSRPDPVPAAGIAEAPSSFLNLPLAALLRRTPVTVHPDASIRDVAQRMRAEGVSCVMLMCEGRLCGLITDRDLRNRVIADGVDTSGRAADIATTTPQTVPLASTAFDALLLMTRHNIHHLPVMDGETIAGMLTTSDLTGQQGGSAVYMVGEICKQSSLDGLVQVSRKLKPLQRSLAAANASAYSIGHIITSITDALTLRLLALAETELGAPPVPYVWVAAGSQARHEQTAKSDQDNCMVLDDSYKESAHGEYFRTLSRQVCDGLAACGYIHCPGGMMAMTDKWRQPRRVWAQYFHQWVDVPEPMALMLTSVFFDQRAVHGATELLDRLRADMLARAHGHSLFLAHMVGNALKLRPPLGLLGRIATQRGGEHPGTVDLKHNGIAPIVDLARIYALAGGIPAVNTHDRLELAAASGEVSAQGARDLRDALEFLGSLRIEHQQRLSQQNLLMDNFLALREISNFERTQLTDAFVVVKEMQAVLAQRYQGMSR